MFRIWGPAHFRSAPTTKFLGGIGNGGGNLVAPGPVLRDTARLSQRYPPIGNARYGGFWCLNMANWARYPLPLFSAFPPWRACEVEVRYPPLKRGISAILARYPMKTREMGAIPPSAILSRKGIARYGGVSRTGPLRAANRVAAINPPIDDTDPIRKFSIDPGATRTGKNKQNSLQKGSRYGISVSTPHRRYGHRLQTPFLRAPFPRLLQYDWTVGVLDNGNEWRKFRAVPRLYPLRSLVCTLFNKGGSRGAFFFRLPGASGDHFHCTVEPSPGHIRC